MLERRAINETKVEQVGKVVKIVKVGEIVWDSTWRRGGRLGILVSCTNTIIDTDGVKWDIPEACLLSRRRRRQSEEKQAYYGWRAFQRLKPGDRLEITRSKETLSNRMNVLVRILPRE